MKNFDLKTWFMPQAVIIIGKRVGNAFKDGTQLK